MNCCSIAWSKLGPFSIEHNNGDDDDDDGQGVDHDLYQDHVHNYWWSGWWLWLMTINLGQGHSNNCELWKMSNQGWSMSRKAGKILIFWQNSEWFTFLKFENLSSGSKVKSFFEILEKLLLDKNRITRGSLETSSNELKFCMAPPMVKWNGKNHRKELSFEKSLFDTPY